MTSSEFLKQQGAKARELGDGQEEQHDQEDEHEEFAIVDRAGRLQLPREYMEAMQISDKVRLEWDGERIIVGRPGGGWRADDD